MKQEPATSARKCTSKLRKHTATPQLGSDPRRRQRPSVDRMSGEAALGTWYPLVLHNISLSYAVLTCAEAMTHYRGTWEDEDEEMPNMGAGLTTQNYWDAIHNGVRAVDIGDDEESVGSEIDNFPSTQHNNHEVHYEGTSIGSELRAQNHAHYEQPEQNWDDQESVGSEIRDLSSLSADNEDEEMSVAHYEQPERDWDDQESVGSEIRGSSSRSTDNDDEEISVGSEINSPSYAPNSSVLDVTMDFIDHGDGVGNVVKDFGKSSNNLSFTALTWIPQKDGRWLDRAESLRVIQHASSEMSLDFNEENGASVGSEVIPQYLDCENEESGDTPQGDQLMRDWKEATKATSSQPQVHFGQGSGLTWDSLVGYGSSEDKDEDFPSSKERPLPPQSSEPQYAVPTAAGRRSTSSLPQHAVLLPMHHAESYVSPPRQRGSAMPHIHPGPLPPNHGSTPTPQRRRQERPVQFPRQGGAVPPLRSSPTSHQRHFQAVPPPRQRDTLSPHQRPLHTPRTSPNSRQQPQPVHAVPPPRLRDTVPPHQRPVPPPRTRPTSGQQPVHGVPHSRQGDILPPHQRPVPPPHTSATTCQEPQSVHSVPPPRQGDTLPPHQRLVPPPRTGSTPRQQPVHSVPHPRQGDTVPPHQHLVPPAHTGPTSRQQPVHSVPTPRQGDTVPPHLRPVPPPRTSPTSRQQPFHGVPHPRQGDTVPPYQRPVPPPPDRGNTPGPQHSPPVPPRYNTAHPTPQKSGAPPKNSRRRTIQIDSSRARKRSNIGLPKRKQKSEKLILAEAVRELLGGLEECGALPDQVQQFQQRRLPRYGPRAGMLEYDTVGTMGSEWNRRLTDVTLELCSTHPVLATADASDVLAALKSHLRYRRANFKKHALNRSPDPELEEQRRLDINKYNRQHNRHDSRLFGLNYFAHEPSVQQNLKIMQEMDPAIHSEDESKGDGRLITRHPPWRSRQNIVTDFFRVPDVLTFATHFRSLGCKHRLPGQLPAVRAHIAEINPTNTRIPVGLPENMYDEQWLRRYKEDEPLLYGTLKVQPPIDFRSIQFSGPVMSNWSTENGWQVTLTFMIDSDKLADTQYIYDM
ncbi:hypothetical protein DFH09DRAFT_1081424 [Mycena vulgaris]|nr:hypothetical protein DFH09DRAFT_1081424 [Mycena vulgaris]